MDALIGVGATVLAVLGGIVLMVLGNAKRKRPEMPAPSRAGAVMEAKLEREEVAKIDAHAAEELEELNTTATTSKRDAGRARRDLGKLILLLLIPLIGGCPKQPTAPSLFADEPPRYTPPAVEEFQVADDECEKETIEPGVRPSFLDDEGLPVCGAQLVPSDRVYDLLVAEKERDHAVAYAEAQSRARDRERHRVDQEYAAVWLALYEERRLNRWQKIAGDVKLVGGTALGVALTTIAAYALKGATQP